MIDKAKEFFKQKIVLITEEDFGAFALFLKEDLHQYETLQQELPLANLIYNLSFFKYFFHEPEDNKGWRLYIRTLMETLIVYNIIFHRYKTLMKMLTLDEIELNINTLLQSLNLFRLTYNQFTTYQHPKEYILTACADLLLAEYVTLYANMVYKAATNEAMNTLSRKNRLILINDRLKRKQYIKNLLQTENQTLYCYTNILIFMSEFSEHEQPHYNLLLQNILIITNNFNTGNISENMIELLMSKIADFYFKFEEENPQIQNEPISNVGLFTAYKELHKSSSLSPEDFERGFKAMLVLKPKIPTRTRVKSKNKLQLDAQSLKSKINFLSALQKFCSGHTLKNLLRSKLQSEKDYIALLDPPALKEYYDLICSTLVRALARKEDSIIIRWHDLRLMEYATQAVNGYISKTDHEKDEDDVYLNKIITTHPSPV